MNHKETVFAALEEVKNSLPAVFPGRLSQLLLYGSYARGEANEDSDVDLLVVWERPAPQDHQKLRDMIFDLEKKYNFDFLISLTDWSEPDYRERKKAGSLFLETIEKEGKILWART